MADAIANQALDVWALTKIVAVSDKVEICTGAISAVAPKSVASKFWYTDAIARRERLFRKRGAVAFTVLDIAWLNLDRLGSAVRQPSLAITENVWVPAALNVAENLSSPLESSKLPNPEKASSTGRSALVLSLIHI